MRNWGLAMVLALALSGCGAPYQPESGAGGWLGRDGGYAEQQAAPYTYVVRFAGNRWDDREDAEWRALYRAAEITVREGGDFFIVVASNFRQFAGSGGADPRAGGAPFPQPQFRDSSAAGGPQAEAFVRLYSGPVPTDLEGAYDARKVISEGL
jgi:hypothetical protein